eukprot:1137049-Pelagomonas_calceolata.AAC.5
MSSAVWQLCCCEECNAVQWMLHSGRKQRAWCVPGSSVLCGRQQRMVWQEVGHGVAGSRAWCGRQQRMVWQEVGHGVAGSSAVCGRK